MNVKNYVRFEFQSLPENISFARSCVAAFAAQLDCTLDDIEEIKLVVSEAVSNSIIHGYASNPHEKVVIAVSIMDDDTLEIIVEDYGVGIEDVEKAMEPTYSTDPSRMGLGFTFMKSFMDELEVVSKPGKGTTVKLKRNFAVANKEAYA
ncbi:stage II sporulation protein AB (anti-sigma F factor) [Thermosyntropha lipolytica DSM 11003]|uniref:Anti-sigma F factor n=1 Tax=Thermosyntropha lipolytica DSM 11003 TaxID=1123382 RepID=A0A1M5R1M9_9FIRM|nr:anti-sigma F factor [Thermosyntropha lipolytica]SHH20284.1 stage II sporulation protein AB (anti-sigma F factor) [Thermosyntropha lipolytica DSM 11003]